MATRKRTTPKGRGIGRRVPRSRSLGNALAEPIEDYGHNLLVGTSLRSLGSSELRAAASSALLRHLVGVPESAAEIWDEDEPVEPVRPALRRYLRRAGTQPRPPRTPASPLRENLTLVGDKLGFDAEERAVLAFLVAVHTVASLRELVGAFGDVSLPEAAGLVAAATDLPYEDVLRVLGSASRLLESGLVSVDSAQPYSLEGKLELQRNVIDMLALPGLTASQFVARFLPEAEGTELLETDFAHLEARFALVRELLAAALRAGRRGINVLLYGPTGTGKTAMASLLARELGARLHVAGLGGAHGEPPAPNERFASLLLGQQLAARGEALLLFDELEDLFGDPLARFFGGDRLAGISKQSFNRLLETNPVPTIWITNRIDSLDDAYLRRFTYSIELPALGPRQRARVLAHHLGGAHHLSPGDIDSVAQRFTATSPAAVGSAVATARLLAEDGYAERHVLERVLAPAEQLLTGQDPLRRPVFDASAYAIDCLASREDLAAMADRLEHWQPGAHPGVSLCLFGPPGTGKTEYARYLAYRMQRPVLSLRVSDILDAYVGQTEQRIADAFRRAEAEDAVLLFDEADTFLRDRRQAAHSWEASQVNEFLQQLETFRGVVVCTTNLVEELDPASLRRFVFKIEFTWLAPHQGTAFFRSLFADLLAKPLSPDDEATVRRTLAPLRCLAPGDFAVVARRWQALGARPTPRDLADALVDEVRGKAEVGTPVWGF